MFLYWIIPKNFSVKLMNNKPSLVLALLFVFVILFSCQTHQKTTELEGEELSSVKFPEVDSVYLEDLEVDTTLQSLDVDVLKSLIKRIQVPDSTYFNANVFQEFLKIDSLKKSGKYEEYLEHLDIGMLRDAEAFDLGEVKLGKQSAQLWGLRFSSYEACPYYHGVDLFLSFKNESEVSKTILVGSKMDWTDPPMIVENSTFSTLIADQLVIKYREKETELADEGESDKVLNVDRKTFYFDLEHIAFVR